MFWEAPPLFFDAMYLWIAEPPPEDVLHWVLFGPYLVEGALFFLAPANMVLVALA